MERYNKILEKRKREIVLLRGSGCVYGKCPFCDYHLDKCADEEANYMLNRQVLSRVTGEFGDLEVINSGSVFELDSRTLDLIRKVSREKEISTLHFESHYLYKERIPALRQEFSDFAVKMKLGLESFDWEFRETVLKKGIPERDPEQISRFFDEANFLFGLTGQTAASMERAISIFLRDLYPKYRENRRIDILIENTDFGVGD